MQPVMERFWSLRQEPTGPLTSYLDTFAHHLEAQGFKRRRIGRQIRTVSYFSAWLERERITLERITDEHIPNFFGARDRISRIQQGEPATLKRLVSFLRQRGVIPLLPTTETVDPVHQAVDAFVVYLRDERSLTKRTLEKYAGFVEQLLSGRFGQGLVQWENLCASDIFAFVQQQVTTHSPAVAKSSTTALRALFQYLQHSGLLAGNLAVVVPTVPNWSMTAIPRAILPEHARAVLAHCPRDTPIGRRDYAILLLLARLGLRAGEVVALSLDSIDWNTGVVRICGKGQQTAALPLPTDVGEAIADYLQNGRPRSDSRRLFLRALAPVRGLGSAQTVTTLVGAAIKRAGVDSPSRGAHQFRHALATDMLRQGATLKEIATVLRHRHVKTTGIYAKVDIVALRSLSPPWPGSGA